MAIILIILAAVFVSALGLHAYKQYRLRQQQRIKSNEYNAAVALWEYAGQVRSHIDQAVRQGAGVLDSTKIALPSSEGYRLSLELIGTYFRVFAVPERYDKTGRLSFLTDNTLTVRAADRAGQQATTDDPEYKGEEAG